MKHFLSYIIPCYNGARWIGEAIDSIFIQGLEVSDFEIVITDDGSTDNSKDVLEKYKQKYSNLKVIYHSRNIGVYGGAMARNTCVENSKGNLIFELDQDNYFPPNTIPKLISTLDKHKWDMVCTERVKFFRGEKDKNGNYEYGYKGDWVYKICDEGYIGIRHILTHTISPAYDGNYLFTRESFNRAGGYPDSILDSFGFGLRQVAHGCKMMIAFGTYYWHRVHPDSAWTTNANKKDFRNEKAIAERLREFPQLFTGMVKAYLNSGGNFEDIGRKTEEHFFLF